MILCRLFVFRLSSNFDSRRAEFRDLLQVRDSLRVQPPNRAQDSALSGEPRNAEIMVDIPYENGDPVSLRLYSSVSTLEIPAFGEALDFNLHSSLKRQSQRAEGAQEL